jgi:hypothetical protein
MYDRVPRAPQHIYPKVLNSRMCDKSAQGSMSKGALACDTECWTCLALLDSTLLVCTGIVNFSSNQEPFYFYFLLGLFK